LIDDGTLKVSRAKYTQLNTMKELIMESISLHLQLA